MGAPRWGACMRTGSLQSLLRIVFKSMLYLCIALAAIAVSFLIFLLGLKDTPAHNGDELPSIPLLSVSLILAIIVGIITLMIVHGYSRHKNRNRPRLDCCP